jgi:hypothetical protein
MSLDRLVVKHRVETKDGKKFSLKHAELYNRVLPGPFKS